VVSERVRGGPGDWSLAVVASAAALDARERTLLTRLLLTSVGLVVSIGGLGLVFARQQRRAAALEERLRHDQERRALEEQIARAEKLLTVGVLAAGIAHEIGTPLAIIRGRAEAQLEKVSDAPTVTALKAIVEQIDRISSTIRQVLDFAHRQPVAVRPTDARAAASRALAMLDWRFRRKEVTARLDVEADVPQIAADPDQLQQTLLNLLLNSCDACARGGTVRIRIGGDVAVPGTVRIAIEDDGCGIAPENIQAVFDPFFTTKGRGEGTGLGLFVASNIVRRHGGRIRLESDPGKGTTAIIDWPIAAGSAGGA
jgi:signal transduction histidine kinase